MRKLETSKLETSKPETSKPENSKPETGLNQDWKKTKGQEVRKETWSY